MRKATVAKNAKQYTFQTILVGEGYALQDDDRELLAAHLGASPIPDFAGDPLVAQQLKDTLTPRCETYLEAYSSGGWMALFHAGGEGYATAPQATQGLARALALLFLLRKSAVT
jgi:hypothetical protein